MMQPANHDRLLIVIVMLLVIISGMLVVIEHARRAAALQKRTLAEEARAVGVKSDVRQRQLDEIESAFLTEEGVISFIHTMDGARDAFDAFELTFTSDVPLGKAPLYLPITIVAEGTRDAVEQFLRSLFASRSIIEIEEFSFGKDEKSASEAKLTLQGKLYVSNK